MPPQREVAIARFRFNAWAKYPDWKQDDRIPERVAAKLKLPLYRARGGGGEPDIVVEGGAIDGHRRGTLLTPGQCLLHPAGPGPKPGPAPAQAQGLVRDHLG